MAWRDECPYAYARAFELPKEGAYNWREDSRASQRRRQLQSSVRAVTRTSTPKDATQRDVDVDINVIMRDVATCVTRGVCVLCKYVRADSAHAHRSPRSLQNCIGES